MDCAPRILSAKIPYGFELHIRQDSFGMNAFPTSVEQYQDAAAQTHGKNTIRRSGKLTHAEISAIACNCKYDNSCYPSIDFHVVSTPYTLIVT
jgi:hypothetical protein